MTLLLAVIAVMFLLSGCGQSGPLYVPGNPSTMAVPPSNSSAEEESDEEDGTPEASNPD
jgi:predicted small lipoprotein YifL